VRRLGGGCTLRGVTQLGSSALAALAAAAAAALLAAGCGSSSSPVAHVSSSQITRAADVSSSATGYRTVMTIHESIASLGNVTVHATGSFQGKNGSLTMTVAAPGAASALGTLQFQMVLSGETVYLKLPTALAQALSSSKPWIEIDLASAGKSAGIPGLSSLLGNSQQLTDPGGLLDYLRATAAGSVEDLGQAQVDGFQTTHYHAKIQLSKLPDAFPASERAAIEQTVAALSKRASFKEMPVDVWIDSTHHVRRFTIEEPFTVNGKTSSVDVQADFPSYGPQSPPTVPPASEVANASSLLKGLSSLGG